jgi:hypothetical protein
MVLPEVPMSKKLRQKESLVHEQVWTTLCSAFTHPRRVDDLRNYLKFGGLNRLVPMLESNPRINANVHFIDTEYSRKYYNTVVLSPKAHPEIKRFLAQRPPSFVSAPWWTLFSDVDAFLAYLAINPPEKRFHVDDGSFEVVSDGQNWRVK